MFTCERESAYLEVRQWTVRPLLTRPAFFHSKKRLIWFRCCALLPAALGSHGAPTRFSIDFSARVWRAGGNLLSEV
jgi:hypothetical protein